MSRTDPLIPPPEFLVGLDPGPDGARPRQEGQPATPKPQARAAAAAATLPPKRRPEIAATLPGPPQALVALLGTPVVLAMANWCAARSSSCSTTAGGVHRRREG
jgi:hypothetical protein